MIIHEMNLNPKPYDLIASGSKTVEVRLYDEKRAALKAGDLIIFNRPPYHAEPMYRQVGAVSRFETLAKLFEAYSSNPAALGCEPDETAEKFASGFTYYTAEDIEKYGVCAIELETFTGEYDINITRARRINEREIEIYFDGTFEYGHDPAASEFAVSVNGKPLEIERGYGHEGRTHFYKMTTLRLAERLPVGDDAPAVTVTYKGVDYTAIFEDYYKYKLITKSGVMVKGSDKLILGMETIKRAGELVDIQLSASPEIAAQMVESGASLSIFGRGECAYHVPEHRGGYNIHALYVEGFGGIACSITEANVWHWHRENDSRPDPDYSTHYHNENILIHEFGHGVKIAGIDRMADRSLATEFQMLYRHAKSAGLWPNTYAISNSDEYFATLSAIWFNVMNECSRDDGWDGTRGPINTRRELYNYDIDAYKFFSKIYPHRDLDGAWTPVPNTVHVTGLKDDPEEDFTGCNFTLNYPELDMISGAEIKLGEEYKIVLPRGGFIIDTAASDGNTGLWYDYSSDSDDIGAMSFVFETIPGKEMTERRNEIEDEYERTYTVYIKGVRDGYLCKNGDRIRAGERADALEFTVTLTGDHGFAAISCGELRLIADGKPDMGTPLKLVAADEAPRRGGFWRLVNIADSKRKLVFVHNATANGNPRGTVAASGETVKLSAPKTDDNGAKFKSWRISNGEISDMTANESEFVMPDGDTVIWALYE